MEIENNNNGEMTLESKIQINGLISMVKNFLPDFAKFYPMIIQHMDNAQDKADEYLGDGEKLVVGFRKGQNTMVLSIDANKNFNFSNAVEKTLSKDDTIKRISELELELKQLKDSVSNNIPVVIPASKVFTADSDAILVREGVRSFIENKVLGNSTVKYVLDYMKEEYHQNYAMNVE